MVPLQFNVARRAAFQFAEAARFEKMFKALVEGADAGRAMKLLRRLQV
jgi:hypothetical protein